MGDRRILAAILSIPACLCGMAAGVADQSDPRLPALFERLQHTVRADDARLTEMMIWQIWGESGAADLDGLLAEGEAAMAAGNFKLALARFDAVIAARPDFAEVWNRRATLHYLAGDYPASLADIEKVLELEPRHFGALSGLGLVNLALARDAAALDAFQRVLALYPANASARQNLEAIEQKLRENEI